MSAIEMVPTVELPPVTPFTVQVTLVSVLPVTTPVYCDELPSVIVVAPLNNSVMSDPSWFQPGGGGGAVSVTVMPPETDGSAR